MNKLFIVDASGYLYRSYHAIRNMTNSQGESTNALFGFIRSILKLQKDFQPHHLVAVFDGPNNIKKRKEIYPEYKAHREKMPLDLRPQIDWARDFCAMYGIPFLNIPEVEADDAMGSVAVWGKGHFDEVFLCTSDKDMAQLVDGKTKILNTHKENLILGPKEVEEQYGVPPEKIIDLLAITGDSSDNIPGLPGFGPKTAVDLLKSMGTLDNVLSNPDKVPGKKKQETIIQEGGKARLSRLLVTIDTKVPIPIEKRLFAIGSADIPKLQSFYSRMGFNSLLKELEGTKPSAEGSGDVSYTLIDDEESFRKMISILSKAKEICFDTETTGVQPIKAELVGIGFGIKPREAWYVPVNGKLGLKSVLEGIRPLMENTNIGFYGHNVKYDYQIMGNYGITIATLSFDTIIASYLLNSNQRQHNLDALTLEYFSKVKIPISDLIGKGQSQISMRDVAIEKVSTYCCEDVDFTCRLKELLEKQLHERKLIALYKKIELPLLKVLAHMERYGIYLDVPALKKTGDEIAIKIKALEKEIFTIAGEEFNLNSPKQLSHILFDKMGIAPPKKTATGFSTNADVLESLRYDYPIMEKLIEYRTLEKLRSTYIETLPLEVYPKTHRIHCTFNQTVAATGRLSCQDPNLQNIPIRTEVGRSIREAFRPEKKGWSYLSADYSQIELRLVAHFSEDPNLIEAFRRGEDIHAHTAATIFGVPLDKITSDMRYRAKAVNFGVIYGQQAFGLARELGIDVKEAKAFIDMYFERFSKVKEYLESCKELARKAGKAMTVTGRERAIPEITSSNQQIRAAAERLAINTPLQGSAADLIKIAMLNIDRLLKEEELQGYMILQIHDELIFELPDFETIRIESLVKTTMEKALPLKVPLVVNIGIGKNWKEC